jgi:hypothetical protein
VSVEPGLPHGKTLTCAFGVARELGLSDARRVWESRGVRWGEVKRSPTGFWTSFAPVPRVAAGAATRGYGRVPLQGTGRCRSSANGKHGDAARTFPNGDADSSPGLAPPGPTPGEPAQKNPILKGLLRRVVGGFRAACRVWLMKESLQDSDRLSGPVTRGSRCASTPGWDQVPLQGTCR